jgi:hypothetical protein
LFETSVTVSAFFGTILSGITSGFISEMVSVLFDVSTALVSVFGNETFCSTIE